MKLLIAVLLTVVCVSSHLAVCLASPSPPSVRAAPQSSASFNAQLLTAAINNDADRIKSLIARGASVSAADADGGTPLMNAASARALEAVQALVDADPQKATINRRDATGRTALMNACAEAASPVAAKIVTLLLNAGADPNVQSQSGKTALLETVTAVPASASTDPIAIAPQTAILQLLLDKADVETKNKRGETALYLAAKLGRADMVKSLLDKGADPAVADNQGDSPLLVAIQAGQSATVAALLQSKKIDVNKADPATGQTALQRAAIVGNTQIADALMGSGADTQIKDAQGKTASDLANDNNHPDVARTIQDHVKTVTDNLVFDALEGKWDDALAALTAGADVNAAYHIGGKTALMYAAAAGETSFVRALLDKGAAINATDTLDYTALMSAASKGNTEVVQLLLDHRADLSRGNSLKQNAAYLAAYYHHGDTAQVLIQRLKDLDAEMVLAAKSNDAGAVTDRLAWGADLEAVDADGSSALTVAAGSGAESVAELLLARGANANVVNGSGTTPLMAASAGGSLPLVALLLESGAVLAPRDKQGETAFLLACDKGWTDVASALLAKGADANDSDPGTGTTALMRAASFGSLPLVQLILSKGGRRDQPNSSGETALQIAQRAGHQEIVALLKNP